MSAFDIFFSFAVTWGVGLGFPSIVRYAIFRRALRRDEAIGWAFGLTLVMLVLFVLLGSQSKTHAVLLLVGVVSYRLLQAKNGPWDRTRSAGTSPERMDPIPASTAASEHPPADFFDNLPRHGESKASGEIKHFHFGAWSLAVIGFVAVWFSAIGMRVAYELGGNTNDLFLVQRYDPPAEFDEGDITNFEHHLLLDLGAPSAIAKKREFDEDRSASSDSFAREFARYADESTREKRAKLAIKLESRQLPELTPSKLRELSGELSVPEQTLREKGELVRQLLMLRLRHERGVVGALMQAQVFGTREPIYSVIPGLLLVVALGPILALLAIWAVAIWIGRGFRGSRNHDLRKP